MDDEELDFYEQFGECREELLILPAIRTVQRI